MSNSYILTKNPLQDEEFLLALDAQSNRETFARLTALTWDENPIEYIEGKITGGTINIDGASALRRTLSLSMVAYDVNLDNFYQGLNTKIWVEVGVCNNINPAYPDIIWFRQGTFIITSFTTSVSTNAYSISIQGKDKMCLLNGDVSGNLPASIDFGVEEYYDLENDTITYFKIPIKDIIKNAVHTYAKEPLHNIIISDLDTCGYELLEYRGDDSTPLYLLRDVDSGMYLNMSTNKDQSCFIDGDINQPRTLGSLEDSEYLSKVSAIETNAAIVTLTASRNAKRYQVCKIGYKETVGYRRTDLTYAGDLISSIGESITSILDKIQKMLGNFEYFYDLDGRFVFQKKKNNLYQNWNPIQVDTDGELYVDNSQSPVAYTFSESTSLVSLSHTPTLNNIKNDFSIWGVRKGVGGADIPIHMRYAIDIKPTQYQPITVTEQEAIQLKYHYGFEEVKAQTNKPLYSTIGSQPYDWREIIYQMAMDYYTYGKLDDFEIRVAKANPECYPTGKTGYETYYLDIQGFWRQLYNPTPDETESDNFYNRSASLPYWNKKVDTDPATLNFWFDFLDANSSLSKYSIPAIGSRSKVVNDTKVKSIYFKEVPSVLFITDEEMMEALLNKTAYADQSSYTYIRINDSLKSFFTISSQGLSAHDRLEELLSTHTYCTEAINISALPIYYLQPNSRIRIEDTEHNISGDYLISKITLPLTYNGTMSLTTTKAAETIY